ncbi:hypothetical protein Hsw_2765 [Hymenobacter swuensis DY53]|uniref:Uncharacterized protein n=1 Tax=Hymenobacter swuensis DY53 TaxID=1227739 RepID=W8F9H2_9BACT|nr:hypothetical protein Hsw_2765 [Hymenobacter swuensis DY53]
MLLAEQAGSTTQTGRPQDIIQTVVMTPDNVFCLLIPSFSAESSQNAYFLQHILFF